MLPSSLQALAFRAGGRASLPDLKHLTALTELRFESTILTPGGGQLPHLPAMQVFSENEARYLHPFSAPGAGPRDLGLASSAPNLTKICFSLGTGSMSEPHEQLATLVSLA